MHRYACIYILHSCMPAHTWTDGRTDGQTDRRTDVKRRKAEEQKKDQEEEKNSSEQNRTSAPWGLWLLLQPGPTQRATQFCVPVIAQGRTV